MTRKRVGVTTHWWRRESEQNLTLGQLKSPNTMQSDRREMMVSSVQIRDMLSGGRVLGLRYTTATIDGSVLKSRSHTIRLT